MLLGNLRRRNPVLWMCVTAMLTAVNVVLSMSIFSVPVPGGHLYLNDIIIDTAALLLDPLGAFVVGGIGAFLGDFFFYPAPMFVSLVTHGLQAVVISLLSAHLFGGAKKRASGGVAVVVGALIMVLGYTVGRAFVYSTPEYALLKLPFQFLQAGVGAAAAWLLCYPLKLGDTLSRTLRK